MDGVLEMDWEWLLSGLAIGIFLGGSVSYYYARFVPSGVKGHDISVALPIPTKELVSTLSEVQQGYVKDYFLKGSVPCHQSRENQGDQSKVAVPAGPAATPLRQSTYYGKFFAWSLEHAPSWDIKSMHQDYSMQMESHHVHKDIKSETSLKRTWTSAELAATISSPDSFQRVAVDITRSLESFDASSNGVAGGISSPSELQLEEGSEQIMVWRSSSLDEAPPNRHAESFTDDIDSSREIYRAPFKAPSTIAPDPPRTCELSDIALDDDGVCGESSSAFVLSTLTTAKEEHWQQHISQASIAVLINFREVMPRPKQGLLKRMLRVSKVDLVRADVQLPPAILLHSGAEYHIEVQVVQPAHSRPGNMTCRIKWICIAAQGCAQARVQVLPTSKDAEEYWTGACVWLAGSAPVDSHPIGRAGLKGSLISMSLGLQKVGCRNSGGDMCIDIKLHAIFDAPRDGNLAVHDTAPFQQALLDTWLIPPEKVFDGTCDIVLCKL